jgi:hypothetical protein
MSDREIRTRADAACRDCDWTGDALPDELLREGAQQHAEQNDHRVQVVTTTTETMRKGVAPAASAAAGHLL